MNVKEDEKGYISFVISNQNRPLPTHPQLSEFLEKITEKYANSRYFTYRCASKLFDLQEFLQSNRIPYQLVLGILDRHRLQNASTISPVKLKQIIFNVFYAAARLGYFLDEDNKKSDATNFELKKYFLLNLIWNIFDPKRSKAAIAVQELKQLLLILCESSCFQSKLYEYFDIVADHNQCIPRTKFEAMLLIFAKIFAYIDESANQFGANWISSTVRDCYENSPGLGGLDNLQFLQIWGQPDGNFVNFSNILSLLQRLNESQFVLHGKRCAGCNSFPIRGLRFKCQRCRKLSLCLKCFTTGFSNEKHCTSHKMLEISSNESVGISGCSRFFAKIFNRKTSKSHRMDSLENLEIKLIEAESGADPNSTNSVRITSHSTLKRTLNKSVASNYFAKPMQQTNNKISKVCDALMEQNERFLNNFNAIRYNLSQSQVDFLENHYHTVQEQIKELKEYAGSPCIPFSSTPFRTAKKRQPLPNLNISTPLLTSIQGAEVNRSFIEENKSLSINDISKWFQTTEKTLNNNTKNLENTVIDTKMVNFRKLLGQVKEIVDDSYSDNRILSTKTKMLECALDEIIDEEMEKRSARSEF